MEGKTRAECGQIAPSDSTGPRGGIAVVACRPVRPPLRLLRILLNAATLVSLALSVALVTLWWRGDVFYVGHRPQWSVSAEDATLTVHRAHERKVRVRVQWAILAGVALPVAFGLRRRWHRRGTRGHTGHRGCCPTCGY